jgi:hypothetical protein
VGVIAQLPIRSLRLETQGFKRNKVAQ